MISKCCSKPLRIVRTYNAGPGGKTQEAHCDACGKRWTLVTTSLNEIVGRGSGPRAAAKQIQKALPAAPVNGGKR
jgi:hypothetical protein